MLVALTMERFVAVCHPEKSRALQGSHKAYFIIASIPICTFLTYSPHLFLSELLQCVTEQGMKNREFVFEIFPQLLVCRIITIIWSMNITYMFV